jgi:hypothetical protein
MNMLPSRALLGSALAMIVALTACASGYKSFYTPASGLTAESIASRRAAPPSGNPIIERAVHPGARVDLVLAAYEKRGFIAMGSSSFNTENPEPEDGAIQQARAVGADLVLILTPRDTTPTPAPMPLTTPPPDAERGLYGPDPSSREKQPTNFPAVTSRSDHGAVYFFKVK